MRGRAKKSPVIALMPIGTRWRAAQKQSQRARGSLRTPASLRSGLPVGRDAGHCRKIAGLEVCCRPGTCSPGSSQSKTTMPIQVSSTTAGVVMSAPPIQTPAPSNRLRSKATRNNFPMTTHGATQAPTNKAIQSQRTSIPRRHAMSVRCALAQRLEHNRRRPGRGEDDRRARALAERCTRARVPVMEVLKRVPAMGNNSNRRWYQRKGTDPIGLVLLLAAILVLAGLILLVSV